MQVLIDLVYTSAHKHEVDSILFLGDLYHTHSVVHLPVMSFWDSAFRRLSPFFQVLSLVGNHDKTGVKGESDNALMLHQTIKLFSVPEVWNGILFVPYFHDKVDFIQVCQANPTATVICHQTFSGSVFENGWEAPDGIEPENLPQTQVISGHVHNPQTLGKVWYPGAPRWMSISDANTERAIWVVEFAADGTVLNKTSISTAEACTPIFALEDTAETPAVLPTGRCKVLVDVYGTPAHVKKRKVELEQAGVRVRTFPDSEKVVKVKESDGIPDTLKRFFTDFPAKNKTSPEVLWQMAQERISWLSKKSG